MTHSPTYAHAHSNGSGDLLKGSSEIVPFSPNNPQPLQPVRVSTEEVRAAVVQARAAQDPWRRLPLAERVAALKSAARKMLARRAEVIELARLEIGKVAVEGTFYEALGPLDTVNGWADVVQRAMSRRVRLNPLSFPKKSARVDMIPRGVVGVIAPWNYPVAGLYRSTIPALLTGNGVVVKPSEYTPRTSAWLVERLAEKLPQGSFARSSPARRCTWHVGLGMASNSARGRTRGEGSDPSNLGARPGCDPRRSAGRLAADGHSREPFAPRRMHHEPRPVRTAQRP